MGIGGALVKTGLGTWGGWLLDALYPPVCAVCDTPTGHAEGLCAQCWGSLRPITKPYCPVLGLPFEVAIGPGALSAQAIAEPPPFRRARSAMLYNDTARALVTQLKYGDRPELAGMMARLMVLAAGDLIADGPVVVPVPLHASRQWRRRYNQSAELGRALAAEAGLDFLPGLVRRARKTRQQVGLSAQARARNVSGAFAVAPEMVLRLKGRPVLLVDDVITTGATVEAVTRALKRQGVDKVDVVSFARVVIGPDMPT